MPLKILIPDTGRNQQLSLTTLNLSNPYLSTEFVRKSSEYHIPASCRGTKRKIQNTNATMRSSAWSTTSSNLTSSDSMSCLSSMSASSSNTSLHSSTSCFSTSPFSQLRRDRLKLSFNRSFSEPNGPITPLSAVTFLTEGEEKTDEPSESSDLPSSKRCRLMPNIHTPSVSNQNLLQLPNPILLTATLSLPSSPCEETFGMVKTILKEKVKKISCQTLSEMILDQSKSPIILDCRPFIAHNINHIQGALNLNCSDRFNRKRLQQGKAVLADLATTKDGKDLLKDRSWKEVIVYDDSTDDIDSVPMNSSIYVVLRALVEDLREPVMLVGGHQEFHNLYTNLCQNHLMVMGNNGPRDNNDTWFPDLPSPSDTMDSKDIENHPATRVLPHLYLGNMKDAADLEPLERLGIRYVLNVTSKASSHYKLRPGIHYKQLEAADNSFQNLRQFFEEAFDFIDKAKENHCGVLVHCQAGISRSPTIAVAYLMKNNPNYSMAEAYRFVKTKRSIISPNLNFMGQLWEFEQVLRLSRSTNLKSLPESGDQDSKGSNPESDSVAKSEMKFFTNTDLRESKSSL